MKKERDYLLDSSLISATFSQIENTKKLYNMKVVYCNDYIQLYTFNNDKFYKNKDIDDKKALNILNVDTDNLKTNNYSNSSDSYFTKSVIVVCVAKRNLSQRK